jgi:hypothetical protein
MRQAAAAEVSIFKLLDARIVSKLTIGNNKSPCYWAQNS